MKKILTLIFSTLFVSIAISSYAQSTYEENVAIGNTIIQGSIGLGEKIADEVSKKKNKEKLEQFKRSHKRDADCYYLDQNGNIQETRIPECKIGDKHYTNLRCSDYNRLMEEYERNEKLRQQALIRQQQEEASYVDLGLPSGTLWKSYNEQGYYTYYQANTTFGNKLPTKEQCDELISYCQAVVSGNGYLITGRNGNCIYLPCYGWRWNTGAGGTFAPDNGYYMVRTLPQGGQNAFIMQLWPNGNISFSKTDLGSAVSTSVRLVKSKY